MSIKMYLPNRYIFMGKNDEIFLQKDDPLEQWKLIWIVTGAVYVIPGMIFVLFSDSELQPWNEVKEKPAAQELIAKEKA